jgi:predicted cobalt transporter CbtA
MPMDENIITWNVTNWITVVLMVAIGFALLGFAQNWWASKQGTQQIAA